MDFIIKYWLEFALSLISTGLIFVIKSLTKKISTNELKQDAIENGMQALLRDRIVQAYYKYSDKRTITLHGLENVEKLYLEYSNLGGNGTVKKLVEDLRKFEVE